jgi:hypothetical protein
MMPGLGALERAVKEGVRLSWWDANNLWTALRSVFVGPAVAWLVEEMTEEGDWHPVSSWLSWENATAVVDRKRKKEGAIARTRALVMVPLPSVGPVPPPEEVASDPVPQRAAPQHTEDAYWTPDATTHDRALDVYCGACGLRLHHGGALYFNDDDMGPRPRALCSACIDVVETSLNKAATVASWSRSDSYVRQLQAATVASWSRSDSYVRHLRAMAARLRGHS